MSENLTPDGYYCDHSDEPWDARTHHGWEWVEEEGQVFTHQPNTLSAHIGFQEYLKPEDRERRCPRAEAVYGHSQVAPLLAEIDRLRAELAGQPAYEKRLREQHDLDVAELNRLRSRVAELERPAVEARRNEIRSTYTELISQAEQDRDFEGAATLTLQLRESEEKWAAEDTKGGAR